MTMRKRKHPKKDPNELPLSFGEAPGRIETKPVDTTHPRIALFNAVEAYWHHLEFHEQLYAIAMLEAKTHPEPF